MRQLKLSKGNFWMRMLIVLVGSGLGLNLGWQVWLSRAATRLETLTNLVGVGQERLIESSLTPMLRHMATMHMGPVLDSGWCQDFTDELAGLEGYLAVIALGDLAGEAVCTSDESVLPPLPTMADRLYFERVREADGLVMGEYVVSKTTGKPVLHFAYPIFSDSGVRLGFVVVAVELKWFANPELDEVFGRSGVEIKAVDRAGKILYSYPTTLEQIGQNYLSAELISFMLNHGSGQKIARGYDGTHKMYSYRWDKNLNDETAVVASVRIYDYLWFWVASGLLGGLVGYNLGEMVRKRK